MEQEAPDRRVNWLHPQDEYGKRRVALLQAGFDAIAEHGFEGLRTRIVAERARVNIATLQYYFPSKQNLIEGLAEFIGARFVLLHGPAPKPSGLPSLDRLRQEFADGRFYRESHPEMLLVLQEFSLRSQRDAHVRKVMEQMNAAWRHGVEQMVHAGIADGTFRDDISPAEMSLILMAIFSGLTGLQGDPIEPLQRQIEEWILSARAKKKLRPAARRRR
jgi:TetR/AcrR family transcriptional regulator, regulator of cefoperazone and chloramphenicol sensitivity